MAKKDTASKRLADDNLRRQLADDNLRRAFSDLVPKLTRAYGQPAGDAADTRSQHARALLAIADFLRAMGPDYLAHVADQFAKLAQAAATTSELVERLLSIMNDKDDPGLSAIDNKRRRYATILQAIAEIGYDKQQPQLGIYIAGLGVALEDLFRGVIDPLFVTKGSKRKGSKRDSMLIWGARLQAALGLECLILSRLPREKAASHAARHYQALASLKRGESRDLKGSLLSWYDRYVEERVPVPELLEAFQRERRELKAANLSPAEYRRRGEQAFAQAVQSAIR
jgi:hypothetical protein